MNIKIFVRDDQLVVQLETWHENYGMSVEAEDSISLVELWRYMKGNAFISGVNVVREDN